MCWKNPRKLFVKQWIWLNKLRNYNVLMVEKWRGPPLGMATGQVFYTHTRPAGHDLWPGLGLFIKRIFFPGPKPAPPSPTSPAQPTNLQPLIVAQSIKKKNVFLRKKNHSSSAAQTTNPNKTQIKSTIPIQISNSQKPNTF